MMHEEPTTKGVFGSVPFRLLRWVYVVPLLVMTCAGEDDFEKFKAFLSSPPVIEEIVFRYTPPVSPSPFVIRYDAERDGLKMEPAAIGERGPADAQEESPLFYGRWQPGGFLLNRVLTGKSEAAHASSWARYENDYRTLQGTVLQLWEDDGSEALDKNAVSRSCRLGLGILSKAINFGVMDIGVGTIQWDGDKFVQQSVAVPGVTIHGEAQRGVDGRINKLDLRYNEFQYTVSYEFERELELPYLPSRFTVHFAESEVEQRRFEVEILSIRTRETNLPRDQFALGDAQITKAQALGSGHHLHAQVDSRWVFSDGRISATDLDGTQREIRTIDELAFLRELVQRDRND